MSYRILHIPTGTYLYKASISSWKIAEYQSSKDAAIDLSYSLSDWGSGLLYFEEEIKLLDSTYGGMIPIPQLKEIQYVAYIENEFEIISV